MKRLYSFLTILVAFSFLFTNAKAQCTGTPTAGTAVTASSSICMGTTALISLTGNSTDFDIVYQWEESVDGGVTFTSVAGGTTSSISVIPTISTAYRCSLTCPTSSQSAVTNSLFITVGTPPNAIINGGGAYCSGAATPNITIDLTGVSPWMLTYSINGVDSILPSLTTTPVILSGQADGAYALVSIVDANACSLNLSGSVSLTTNSIPTVTGVTSNPTACGSSDGSIDITVTGATSPTYSWNNGITTEDVFGLSAGVYSVLITNNNSCTTTFSTTLNGFSAPTVDAGLDLVACPGATLNLNATAGFITYSWISSNGLAFSDATLSNPTIAPSTTGMAYVTVTDANGCSAIDSLIITVNALPTASVSGGGTYCAGDTVPDIIINLTGAAPWTVIYTFNSVNDTLPNISSSPFVASSQPDGNYSLITVSDANNCLSSASGFVTLTTNPLPNVVDTLTNPSGCGLSDGIINLTVVGGVAPTFIWTPSSATTEDISGLAAGTYGVQVDDQGCTFTNTYTLTGPFSTSTTSIVNDETCGLSNGGITLNTTGGTVPYSYSWSTGAITSSISNLSAGTYSCAITDASGCTENINGVVANVNSGTATIIGNAQFQGAPFTQGQAVLFAVTDTTAFTVAEISALDINGNYTFTTALSGSKYVIGVRPNLLANPTIVTTFSGNQHRWDLADTLIATCGAADTINFNMLFLAATTGSATISGTIIDVTDSTDQRRPGEPVIGVDVSVEQIPGGSQVMKTTTDANGDYSFANVPVGNYQLFVNVPGCSMVSTYDIAITASEQVVSKVFYVDSLDGYVDTATVVPFSTCNYVPSYTINDVCFGDSTFVVDLSTGVDTSAMGYQWDFNGDGVTDDTTKGSLSFVYPTAGTFTTRLVIFSYDGSCTDTARAIVNVNLLPRVVALPDTQVCTGNNLTLNASGANFYFWNSTALLSDTAIANPIVNTLTAGTTDFIVFGVDLNGCVASDTASINILLGPIADFYTAASACKGTPVDFYDSTLNATSQTQYFWDFDNNGSVDDTIQGATTYTYPTIGVKTAELLVIGSNGCKDSTTLNVTVNANPLSISAGNDKTITCGSSVQIIANSNQTGATYSWSPHNFVSNPFINNPSAVPDTTIQYIVKAVKNGCAAYDTVIVNVIPLAISGGADQTIVCGNQVQLTGNSNGVTGTIYHWSPGTALTSQTIINPKASPDTTTMYVVTASKNTCYASDTIIVTVNPYAISAGTDQTITCSKTATLVSSVTGLTGVITYSWSPSQGLSSVSIAKPVASPTQTTTYYVAAKKGTCVATDSVVVTVVPFAISAGNDFTVECGEIANMDASSTITSGANYQWSPNTGLTSPNSLTSVLNTNATTTYHLTVTKGACTSTDSVTVTFNPNTDMSFHASTTVYNNMYPPYKPTFTITATNKANLNFSWDFGDTTGVQAATSGAFTHTYSKGGTFTVTLYATTANGACKDTLTYTDYIMAWSPNALPSMMAVDNTINVYPSPGNGEFTIDLKDINANTCNLTIMDITGRPLTIDTYQINNNTNLVTVNMTTLPNGVYLIKLDNETTHVVKHYVKQ